MCYTLNVFLLLAVAAAATPTHTPRGFCTAPWNACLSAEPTREGPATAFCSSYLSVGTVTTTVTPSAVTTDVTLTSTVYSSTTTVFDSAIYTSCTATSAAKDKIKRATATHTLPKCLRRFGTATSAISHACSCLNIPSPTSTVTLTPSSATSTVTTTTTIDSVSTSTQEYFYLQATGAGVGGNYLDNYQVPYGFGFDSESGSQFRLDYSNGSPCPIYSGGQALAAQPGDSGAVNVFSNPPSDDPPVLCTLDASTNILSCVAGSLEYTVVVQPPNELPIWGQSTTPGGEYTELGLKLLQYL